MLSARTYSSEPTFSERPIMSGQSIRRMPSVLNRCGICGIKFRAEQNQIRRGRGKYCSKECAGLARRVPLADRFFDRVGCKTESGCILWNGQFSEGGYGVISYKTGRTGNSVRANRVAYELMVGPIQDGLFVLHRCDNPPCINPTHLFLGTVADNSKDMVVKGRSARGERHGSAAVTESTVLELRERYRQGGISKRSLAREYGIGESALAHILKRRSWSHLA